MEEATVQPLTDPVLRALGSRVRKLREDKCWTQEILGARAGLDRSYIAGIEAGLRNPSVKALARIVRGLGVTIAEVVAHVDARRPSTPRAGTGHPSAAKKCPRRSLSSKEVADVVRPQTPADLLNGISRFDIANRA